ncbi:aspartic peptidase domain-containing protein [Boeremia exigua]|uniref:aspartic peptidase domain-containing protein n=1 Tax=Boeremia exigua TaxID=749465 RepID=UPI001E8D6553|nr:aspartic peptidase domain-containing protein [Boeremia exigua]KAH6642683.1 aspartic peptidase domain-containing protein [Boeremia exigua]
MKSFGLLAAASAAAAAVMELPVRIQDSYSSVALSVGSPPRTYFLLFDTGSSTTWITSTGCTETSCPNPRPYARTSYSTNASSTSQDLNSFSRIPYIDGDSVAGAAIIDTFADHAGGFEWNQTFLSVNESSWRWITADGFVGLGFSSIAEDNTTSLVETLLWDGQLDEPRVGLFYGNNLGEEGEQNGVLTIGGSEEEKYVEGDVVYAPLLKEGPYQVWRAPLRSVNVLVTRDPNATVTMKVGSLPDTTDVEGVWPKANTTWPMYGSGRAVFDTGAGRISLPEEIISAVYFNLGWNMTALMWGDERMDCQHLNASWAITFTLGEGAEEDDVSFSIRGDEFTSPGGQCMPPLDASGGYGFALIGTTFLKRHYSVFDYGADKVENYAPRIGFGRLKKQWDWLYQ